MPKRLDLISYETLVFDCDGVILDSNRIKTDAFRHVAKKYGDGAAEALVQFHVQHGGVSRYKKFEHFFNNILEFRNYDEEVKTLAKAYGEYVFEQLLACPVTPCLKALREATPNIAWMVVSGGDQAELRRLFALRGLDTMFDRGIHGSPATKDEILQRELTSGALKFPGLFFGDSKYDHEAAKRAGLDFVFLSGWTEFSDWLIYCDKNNINAIKSIAEYA